MISASPAGTGEL